MTIFFENFNETRRKMKRTKRSEQSINDREVLFTQQNIIGNMILLIFTTAIAVMFFIMPFMGKGKERFDFCVMSIMAGGFFCLLEF